MEFIFNKYRLFINETHLLFLYQELIERTTEFNYVGLITSKSRELKHISVFKGYVTIHH